MNGFEIALTIFFPVLGACGAWIVWSRTGEYLAERRRRSRLPAGGDLLEMQLGTFVPDNPRLSAEIEQLR